MKLQTLDDFRTRSSSSLLLAMVLVMSAGEEIGMHFTKRKNAMERDNNGNGINGTDTKKMVSKWQVMIYFWRVFNFTNAPLNSTKHFS